MGEDATFGAFPLIAPLLDAADGCDGPAAKLGLLEEAARIADQHGDAPLAHAVREQMLWPAYDAGRPDLLLVTYARCLAFADAFPDAGRREHVLWSYRWVASSMPEFVHLPRPQIEATMDDMERRYAAAGYSLRPVDVLRRHTYEWLGDRAAARAAHDRLAKHRRDLLTDSHDLEVSFKAGYLLFAGRRKEAMRAIEPVLQELMAFDDQAFLKRIQSRYLIALVEDGRTDEAARIQKTAYPKVRDVPRYLYVVGWHVEFLAVVGETDQATKLAERHLAAAIASPSDATRFGFFRAVRFLADRLRRAGKAKAGLKVPAEFAGSPEAARLDPDALAARLDVELADLVHRFNERNGNDYYTEQLNELPRLHALADRPGPKKGWWQR